MIVEFVDRALLVELIVGHEIGDNKVTHESNNSLRCTPNRQFVIVCSVGVHIEPQLIAEVEVAHVLDHSMNFEGGGCFH